jgi:hypothetical protein
MSYAVVDFPTHDWMVHHGRIMPPIEGLGSTDDRVPPLVAALRKLLRPLIRLLLAHRLTFPFLASLLKEIYVEVALVQLQVDGLRQTDSQVSLMTGVHRKDVRRLRAALPFEDTVPAAASRGAALALRWISTPGYQDAEGNPLTLPRTAAVGEPSFDALAESTSKDVRPRALLEELIHFGVTHVDADGRVRLRVEGFVPQEGFAEKVFFFGRSVRDHIAAAVHNLLGHAPAVFERSVYYEGLSEESVRELEELAGLLAMDTLRTLNRRGAALKKRDAGRANASFRITLGSYFFAADKDGPHADP